MSNRDLSPRILAIDLGEKRVGIAVSDPMGHFAVGLETIQVQSKPQLLADIQTLCQQYDVHTIVLGLPISMNGQEGPAAEKVRKWAEWIHEATGRPIAFYDERLTSVLALQTLKAQGVKPSKHKGLVDQAAAKRILQDYLDRNAFQH